MYSATALLPLLAFNAAILAAPTPLPPGVRSVPNIHEVIRNPAPINAKCLDMKLLAFLKVLGICPDLPLHERAVPKVENEAVSVVPVVGRTLPVEFNA